MNQLKNNPNYFQADSKKVIAQLGKSKLLECLYQMLLIRHFEIRAESAYQTGKVGGFFHAYTGQEAIQTAAVAALGLKNWWTTSYRCHALAILLGIPVNDLMAELYGKSTGNAKGRGGSMHFFADRMLGGHGIVGGQIPIATGAGFAVKYKDIKDEVSVCFMGDGAIAQGAFHESLNLASLYDLPCIYVIENNYWGMGTAVSRAISVDRLATDKAPGYNMKGYTFDGVDFFNCYAGFSHLKEEVLKTSRPVLVEVRADRFKGHSISDPAVYRTKEALKEVMTKDPIIYLKNALIEAKMIDEETFKEMDSKARESCVKAMEYADNSPWPELVTLEEDVFAP